MADSPTQLQRGPIDQHASDDHLIGWGLLLAVAASMLALVLVYDPPSQTPAATELAQRLVASMDAAGMDTPDPDVVARTYGTDGGAVCRTAGDDLAQALFNLNHARTGEVTGRPNLVDPRVIQYQRIMIQTYCPARLGSFEESVSGLRTQRVLNTLD